MRQRPFPRASAGKALLAGFYTTGWDARVVKKLRLSTVMGGRYRMNE